MIFAVTLLLLLQVVESVDRQDCLPGTFWDNVRCAPCPRRYYQHLNGQNFCFACPEDRTTTRTGSYAPQQCLCDYGAYTSGVYCIKCPKGTYSDEMGYRGICKPCPASTSTLQVGSTSMEQCMSSQQLQNCPPGNYYDTLIRTCKACPKGTYQNTEGQSQCNACPPSTTTVEPGTIELSQCVCAAGHYRHSVGSAFGWCERCSFDHYQDELNRESCKPCPAGTKHQTLGAIAISQCVVTGTGTPTLCSAGQYLERFSGNCEPCPVGTFNNMEGFNVCIRCSALTTTRRDGSKSQLDCECGPGTYLQQWCQNCPTGQYQDEYGQRVCKSCPPGYSTQGAAAKSSDQCVQAPTDPTSKCQLGFFMSMSGQCLECPIGSYQDDRDRPTCKQCPLGTTTLSISSTNIEACRRVPGQIWNNGYPRGNGLQTTVATSTDDPTAETGVNGNQGNTNNNNWNGWAGGWNSNWNSNGGTSSANWNNNNGAGWNNGGTVGSTSWNNNNGDTSGTSWNNRGGTGGTTWSNNGGTNGAGWNNNNGGANGAGWNNNNGVDTSGTSWNNNNGGTSGTNWNNNNGGTSGTNWNNNNGGTSETNNPDDGTGWDNRPEGSDWNNSPVGDPGNNSLNGSSDANQTRDEATGDTEGSSTEANNTSPNDPTSTTGEDANRENEVTSQKGKTVIKGVRTSSKSNAEAVTASLLHLLLCVIYQAVTITF